MGCRICIEAPLETMPLDLTVLLRSTPTPTTYGQYKAITSPPKSMIHWSRDGGTLYVETEQPMLCRRVATFPLANHRFPKASSIKYRSLSELTDLKLLTENVEEETFATMVDMKGNCQLIVNDPIDNIQEETIDNIDRSGESDQSINNQVQDSNNQMLYLVRIRSRSSLTDDVTEQLVDVGPGPVSPNTVLKRIKKKVAFADDRGLELTTIKVMTEPSDVPPLINVSAIMRQLVGDDWLDDQAVAKPCATWVVNFKQPASDYVAFRKKLDATYIALENVLVKNDQCRLIGTVKVKNICFEKQLFVRFTDNEWRSYYDRPCTYLCTKGSNTGALNDSFDTFQFDFEIPCDDNSQHQRMEFCLCYRTGLGQEYWDNNDGKNYEIISEHLRLQRSQIPHMNMGTGHNRDHDGTQTDNANITNIMNLECKNWTEFASWSDVSQNGDNGYW